MSSSYANIGSAAFFFCFLVYYLSIVNSCSWRGNFIRDGLSINTILNDDFFTSALGKFDVLLPFLTLKVGFDILKREILYISEKLSNLNKKLLL